MRRLRRVIWVGVLAAVLFVGSASSLLAQTQVYVGTPPPQVEGASFNRQPEVIGSAQEVRPAAIRASGQSRGIALTGGDILGLCVLGASALAVGTVLVRSTRRRRTLDSLN